MQDLLSNFCGSLTFLMARLAASRRRTS